MLKAIQLFCKSISLKLMSSRTFSIYFKLAFAICNVVKVNMFKLRSSESSFRSVYNLVLKRNDSSLSSTMLTERKGICSSKYCYTLQKNGISMPPFFSSSSQLELKIQHECAKCLKAFMNNGVTLITIQLHLIFLNQL